MQPLAEYDPTVWVNKEEAEYDPTVSPRYNAQNMNKIEGSIFTNREYLIQLISDVSTLNGMATTLHTSVTGNAIPFSSGRVFRFTATSTIVTASSIPTDIVEGGLYIDNANLITGWSNDFEPTQIPSDLEVGEMIRYEIVNGKIYLGRVGEGFPNGLPA